MAFKVPVLSAVLFLSILSAGPVFADELVLSLTDAIAAAKSRHVDVIVSDERVKQALARSGQSYGLLLPQVSVETSQYRQTRNLEAYGIPVAGPTGPGDPLVGPFNSFDARVTVRQLIFDVAAIERLLAVRAGKKLSDAQLEKAREDSMALVGQLYLNAWRARERLKFVKAVSDRDKKWLRITQRRFREGLGNGTQVRQARAAYKKSLSLYRSAETEAGNAELDLKASLGIPFSTALRFDRERTLSGFGIPTEEELLRIANSHPDVIVAREAVRQRAAERKIPLADYLPRFSVVADYGLSGQEPSESEETYRFGVEGSMNIFDGAQRFFRYRENQSREREAQALFGDAQRQAERRALWAARFLRQASWMLDAQDEVVAASHAKLKIALTGFRNGSLSEWEWTEAALSDKAANDEREQSVADFLLANVTFAHAIGRMEEFLKGPQ